MAVTSYNSVGGYSTGLAMTGVIDSTANITAVAGTFTGTFSGATGSFSKLLTASAGISAAGGVTFAGTFSGTTGSFSGLLTASAGISAAGATFSAPITSTRMARHTSAAISAVKTAGFTPTAAEDGTVFYIAYDGKAMFITLEGLPIGWRAKFFNIGEGNVFFESPGDIYGYGALNGLGQEILEAICIGSETYFVG